MIDLSVFTVGNLFAAVLAGLLAGLYLTVFHPQLEGINIRRRALLQGWYFGFLGSIFYIARIAFSLTRGEVTNQPTDVPRVTAAWLLWILFAACVALGAWVGSRARMYWAAR